MTKLKQEYVQNTVCSIPWKVETIKSCKNYSLLNTMGRRNYQKYIVGNHKIQRFLCGM